MDNLFMESGAEFSGDKKHRYALWRIWNRTKPLVMFIGLNPSTANATDDDPTIKSVIRISEFNGYGGVYMLNLYTYITPHPKELIDKTLTHPNVLTGYFANCRDVVFAWGAFGIPKPHEVIRQFTHALCLGINSNGSPKHPLYIKTKTQFSNFK